MPHPMLSLSSSLCFQQDPHLFMRYFLGQVSLRSREGILISATPSRQAGASPASLAAAQELLDSSGRRIDSFPIRKSFVRAASSVSPDPPLALLVKTRTPVPIKLFLGLVWRSASPPFDSEKTLRGWATLLDLPRPDTSGVSRVRAARQMLEEQNLIRVSSRGGNEPPAIRLLDESGSGEEYELPSTKFFQTDRYSETPRIQNPHLYLKFPTELWVQGLVQQMSLGALAMLLVLLAEQADQKGVWFSTENFPQRYRISAPTRARGTKELIEMGLLRTARKPLAPMGGSEIFDRRLSRKIYRLIGPAAALGTPLAGWELIDMISPAEAHADVDSETSTQPETDAPSP